MFPEPEPRQTTEVKSTAGTAGEPTAETLKSKDQRGTAVIAEGSRHENESVLRMRLALNVARSGEGDERSPDPPTTTGIWIVKSLPRPPLVAAMLREPPADELLANDSLGG